MSNTDEPISIRPPLPICCALLHAGRMPGPSHHRATCSRCCRDVSVNTRVNIRAIDAGVQVMILCVNCWTGADQAIALSYRDMMK
jgi:hypothetical protein